MVITANELKTKGISVVEEAMKTYSRAVIRVRGKRKYFSFISSVSSAARRT